MYMVIGGKAVSGIRIFSYGFFVLHEFSIPDLDPDKCLRDVENRKKMISYEFSNDKL